MARESTELLIDRLARSAVPVRRLPPTWIRVALWCGLGLPPLGAILLWHGGAIDGAALFADRRMLIEQVAALATAVTAAAAAFASTSPGADRRWIWLPAVPLAVWLLAIGRGCLEDWLLRGPEGLALRPDFDCLGPMLLMAAVPAAAMVLMLRRGAPLAPRLSLFLGALATAAIVAFGLRFFHGGDATLMVLVWHMGLAAVLVAAAALAGRHVLFWPGAVRGDIRGPAGAD